MYSELRGIHDYNVGTALYSYILRRTCTCIVTNFKCFTNRTKSFVLVNLALAEMADVHSLVESLVCDFLTKSGKSVPKEWKMKNKLVSFVNRTAHTLDFEPCLCITNFVVCCWLHARGDKILLFYLSDVLLMCALLLSSRISRNIQQR